MLPKKNTSVATLALVFSLAAVPRAIAGSPLSLGSTLTQPSVAPTLPVIRSHQLNEKNLMLTQGFDSLSAQTHVILAQANPNLPRKAQSQSWNGLWVILPILAILGAVWGWYRSKPSQENNVINDGQSNDQQDSDRNVTRQDTEQPVDMVTAPPTATSEQNTETLELVQEVPAETANATETASPLTDLAAVTGSADSDQEFSNTDRFDEEEVATETSETLIPVTESSNPLAEERIQDLTVTTPAAEDNPADMTTIESSEFPKIPSQSTVVEDSTDPPEEEISVKPPEASPLKSDPNTSFSETQLSERTPSDIEAAKFNLGQTKPVEPQLASVDEGLAELPDGYGKTKIVLMPREPNSAYAYWDIPNEDKEKLRKQGGEQLALRFYDVTGIDMDQQKPHSVRQYDCEEMTREWYIDVPISDRDYIVEIGYVTEEGRWLMLARSLHVRIPPVYPCDWYGDDFRTVNWEENLRRLS